MKAEIFRLSEVSINHGSRSARPQIPGSKDRLQLFKLSIRCILNWNNDIGIMSPRLHTFCSPLPCPWCWCWGAQSHCDIVILIDRVQQQLEKNGIGHLMYWKTLCSSLVIRLNYFCWPKHSPLWPAYNYWSRVARLCDAIACYYRLLSYPFTSYFWVTVSATSRQANACLFSIDLNF